MRDKMWKVFVEINEEWVPVAHVETGSWYQAVTLYREKFRAFLNVISGGHGDTVNIEAEEVL